MRAPWTRLMCTRGLQSQNVQEQGGGERRLMLTAKAEKQQHSPPGEENWAGGRGPGGALKALRR